MSREELQTVLERHRKSFARWTRNGTRLTTLRLFMHETTSHLGLNLVWAVGLCLPFVSKRLKRRFARKLTCAFLGFDDQNQSASGCMLHPVRWDGRDVRQETAFRLLRGLECGDRDFVCGACRTFDAGSKREREDFVQLTRDMDWYDYSETVRLVSAGLLNPDGTVPRKLYPLTLPVSRNETRAA